MARDKKTIETQKVEPVTINSSDDAIINMHDQDLHKMKAEVQEYQLEKLLDLRRPEKAFWKRTRFGRFLSGRTKAGRVFRRVGITAAGIGASALGIDLSSVLEGEQQAGGMVEVLSIVRDILLIGGSIIAGLSGSSDICENYLEKVNERESQDGKRRWSTTIFNKIARRLS